MLDLETRMEVYGVTIYRDLDDLDRFYYAAGTPHMAVEAGTPQFDLFTYTKGGTSSETMAGGFLNMTVAADIGNMRGRVERELKQRYGDNVTLTSIPYTRGRARVIALGESSDAIEPGEQPPVTPDGQPLVASGPRFIENILGAGQPSLVGDNRAIFSFSLNEDGAAFFLNVLTGDVDARPVGVVYELEYVGLLPAYDLEITIDFRQSYNYVRSRFTLGTLFFKADLDNIVEELVSQQHIKVREVSRTLELSTPEAVQARQERIDRLVKDLATGALFNPTLTPGQPRVQGDTIVAADPTASTSAQGSGVASAMRSGAGAAIAAGQGSQPGVRVASQATAGGSETSQPTEGESTPGGSSPGETGDGSQPQESAADVWNRLGRPQAAYALKSLSQTEQRTVTYNLSQVTAQKQTIAPQSFLPLMAERQQLNERVHLVNLNHPFFQRINVEVNARNVDFEQEGVRQLTVQVRYGIRPNGTAPKDTAEVILRSADDSKEFTFFADPQGTQSYDYRLTVDYKPDFGIGVKELRLESPWTRTDTRSLTVHPRMVAQQLPVELRLPPNVPDDVQEIEARVSYTNAAHGIDDSELVTLNASSPAHTVHIRLAGAEEKFEVLPTVFYTDGTQETLPPLSLPDPALGQAEDAVVLAPPHPNQLEYDILMQDPLDELEAVLVDTKVGQAETTVEARTYELTQPGQAGRKLVVVRLPQRGVPATLQFQERRVFRSGGLEAEPWQEAPTRNVVVGIPAAAVRTVTVRYLGPAPSSLGVSLIVVDLHYEAPDGNPEFAQETSLMVDDTPDSQLQQWHLRLPGPNADTYQWRANIFFDDGSNQQGDYVSQDGPIVILRPPR